MGLFLRSFLRVFLRVLPTSPSLRRDVLWAATNFLNARGPSQREVLHHLAVHVPRCRFVARAARYSVLAPTESAEYSQHQPGTEQACASATTLCCHIARISHDRLGRGLLRCYRARPTVYHSLWTTAARGVLLLPGTAISRINALLTPAALPAVRQRS